MKIIICSAPKSGNTWLNNILMSVYRLETVALNRAAGFDELLNYGGENWISYLHDLPTQDIFKKLKEMGVVFISIARHPGDQIISMINFSRWYFEADDPEKITIKDMTIEDEGIIDYASTLQIKNLQTTLFWDSLGSQVIRYEDLFVNTYNTIHALTEKICPVKDEDIYRGITLASAEFSTGLRWVKKQFIAEGGAPKKWINLHPSVIRFARGSAVYQKYCEKYGYSFDDLELEVNFSQPALLQNQHVLPNQFDNGEEFHIVFKSIYINNFTDFSSKFPHPESTMGGSFYQWLNLPQSRKVGLTHGINNLMDQVYKLRIDLRREFPRYQDEDLSRYFLWFFDFGYYQVRLPESFMIKITELYLSLLLDHENRSKMLDSSVIKK